MLATFDHADGGAVRGTDRAAVERKFRTARRHSRRVRMLRVALPLLTIFCFAIIGAIAFINPLRLLAKLPIDPTKIAISGTRVTIAGPRVGSFTKDKRPYEFFARSASYDITNPDLLDLTDIHAKIDMADSSTVDLTAAKGTYDRKSELVTLLERIVLVSSSGNEARLTQAVIDMRTGTVSSDRPVEVSMLNGMLNANRMNLDDNGNFIRFDGGVAMTLQPGAMSGDKKAAQQ